MTSRSSAISSRVQRQRPDSYFIFRQPINDEVVLELFDRITRKARNKQIKSLIAIVVKREARAVFKRIGFYEIVSDDVYIDEVNLNETKFKNAVVLKYDLT